MQNTTSSFTLLYFPQRGAKAGYWRNVPLQTGRVDALHAGLRARGHIVRLVPNVPPACFARIA